MQVFATGSFYHAVGDMHNQSKAKVSIWFVNYDTEADGSQRAYDMLIRIES